MQEPKTRSEIIDTYWYEFILYMQQRGIWFERQDIPENAFWNWYITDILPTAGKCIPETELEEYKSAFDALLYPIPTDYAHLFKKGDIVYVVQGFEINSPRVKKRVKSVYKNKYGNMNMELEDLGDADAKP